MSKRKLVIAAIIIGGGIGWYAFRPERLFVNKTVNESLPAEASAAVPQPIALESGSFHDGAHKTSGRATILQLPDGKRTLRLTNFSTSNGPDVHVYLVAATDATDSETVKKAGFIDLGSIKGNIGDQNYDVPADLELGKYQAATIWCARFGVNFGTAPLATQSATAPSASPKRLVAGNFHDGAHKTSGVATVIELSDGRRILRLTNFATSNGPDVHVYLVAASDVTESETVKKAGFVDLGSIKGNEGDQNYDVPAGLDLSKYQAATIWCARFGVNFGTGRLDQLDSVARMSPSVIGFAFNNRLLLGGFAGEPQSTPGSLNPFSDPAQENLTLLLLDAHRMLNFQSAALLKIPAFVKLFRDAFPEEAAMADAKNDPTLLVNDQTEFRAQATFLRTVVTRNTRFDRFLAGDDHALTEAQRRGARLFFTAATEGGAGCFSCHSGPMLNKQPNDPDVAGIGAFVEENFFNVGIGDHPVQALSALARGHLDPTKLGEDGFPYHAEDTEGTHSWSTTLSLSAPDKAAIRSPMRSPTWAGLRLWWRSLILGALESTPAALRLQRWWRARRWPTTPATPRAGACVPEKCKSIFPRLSRGRKGWWKASAPATRAASTRFPPTRAATITGSST